MAHLPNTPRPYHLPEMGQNIAETANRDGLAARLPAPAGPQSLEGDLALLGSDDPLRTALALPSVPTAQPHDAPPLSRLPAVPGRGQSLSGVWLDDLHASPRFPRGQASAGQRYGTAGAKSGNASLPWACSAAAVWGLRNHPAGQQDLARLETKHGTGKACTLLAQPWARAVSDRVRRAPGFERDQWRQSAGNGTGELAASLGHSGMNLVTVRCHSDPTASPNAPAPRGA